MADKSVAELADKSAAYKFSAVKFGRLCSRLCKVCEAVTESVADNGVYGRALLCLFLAESAADLVESAKIFGRLGRARVG